MKQNRFLSFNKVQPTLIQGVLFRIFIVAMILVAILSFFYYFYIYNLEAEKRLDELKEYVDERVKADSVIFELAEDNLQVFKEEFLRLYTSDITVTEEDFWELYFVDSRGATRMKEEQFNGVFTEDGTYRYGMSSFIGNNQSVSDSDFRRRLVLSYRLLSQLGPGWVNRFANVHASFPENGIVLFWPEEPWGLNARADLPMNELSVIKAMTKQENPERNPLWTGLYYDETADEWMITYQVPVDYEGKHLLNPSHDVFLTDIMERLLSEYPAGGYNFLIRKDGYLIAHPSEPSEEQRWVGQLSLDKISIPSVKNSYQLISANLEEGDDSVQIIENHKDNSYLAVGELSGPGWWFVSVLPMEVIQDVAHKSALIYFTQGMILVLIILAVVYFVLRFQAERPLQQLRYAAELIGEGEYYKISSKKIPLPLTFTNEIGLLAKRFVEMATNIESSKHDLEQIVEDRTKELEIANASLEKLSFMDGLTGVYNRRSFDMDIEELIKNQIPFSLIFADVDHFKRYNDFYGHAEGDDVLKKVAKVIQDNIGDDDHVYRYGGEEFAILIKGENIESAKYKGKSILDAVQTLKIPHVNSEHGIVTLSAGFAQYTNQLSSSEDIIRAADKKLYNSKSSGRNTFTM